VLKIVAHGGAGGRAHGSRFLESAAIESGLPGGVGTTGGCVAATLDLHGARVCGARAEEEGGQRTGAGEDRSGSASGNKIERHETGQ
jgi:hypothetical protein